MDQTTRGSYPNTFYRVSLKAIIRDNQGRVLVVKEAGSQWSLPGGGIDHGESEAQALARELSEEVALTESFTALPIGIEQMFVISRDAYLLWVVYEVTPKEDFSWGVGVDADDVAFMNPEMFKESEHRSERLIYKWCVDRGAVVE